MAAVASNFKVHVDDYVWIGLNGLVKLVDKLGGVNILITNPVIDDYFPQDLDSADDPYGYLRVAVLPWGIASGWRPCAAVRALATW